MRWEVEAIFFKMVEVNANSYEEAKKKAYEKIVKSNTKLEDMNYDSRVFHKKPKNEK